MKITSIEIIPVSVPRSRVLTLSTYGRLGVDTLDFVLTRIHTDEGFVGVGECSPLPPLSPESQPVIVAVIRDWLAPRLIGKDPFDIEGIWEEMDSFAPTYPMSKAALDLALHDVVGKALGQPLYRLLGGAKAGRFPLVGLIGIGTEEEVSAEALKFVDAGYTGLRLKIGPGRDMENVKVLRDTVGGGVTIRVDSNQGYSTHGAIRAIRAMERFDIELVEQPTVWWDYGALAKIARAVETPIMPHESVYLISDVKALIDFGAVGVLGLKMYRPGGGITNARRLLDMAKMLNIPCLIHDDVELGVSLAAASHFVAARHRDLRFSSELSGYPEWIADDIVKNPVAIRDGSVEAPERPGLGVELDEEKIKKYCSGKIMCNKAEH